MSSYTLYYFDGRGRAEICRMLFAAAGVQYADKRIELKKWDYFKSSKYRNLFTKLPFYYKKKQTKKQWRKINKYIFN